MMYRSFLWFVCVVWNLLGLLFLHERRRVPVRPLRCQCGCRRWFVGSLASGLDWPRYLDHEHKKVAYRRRRDFRRSLAGN